MRYRANAVLIGILLSAGAFADPAPAVSVTVEKGVLVSMADFVVDRPRPEVVRAFSAFDDLTALNPAIKSSRAEATADGAVRVTTKLRDCIVVFCKSLTLIERVSSDGDGNMTAEIDADGSDFRQGTTTWTFERQGSKTLVYYRSVMEPDFWLPPFLGRHAMQRALEKQIDSSVRTIENGVGE